MSKNSKVGDSFFQDMVEINDHRGILNFVEYPEKAVKRMFIIRAKKGVARGNHAHKECSQWLTVTEGTIEVTIRDCESSRTISLSEVGKQLFIPPGIWTEIFFVTDAKLIVNADQFFEESDYIRGWSEFMEYKAML